MTTAGTSVPKCPDFGMSVMTTAGTPVPTTWEPTPHPPQQEGTTTIMTSRNTIPNIIKGFPSTSSIGSDPAGPLLYAVPAPGSVGKDLLCLCRKVYWTSGSLMYCAYTPVTKEEAAILLKDPNVISILSNPVSGANLLTVAPNGAIVGVQQTVGYINTSGPVSKELEARPKKTAIVTPSSVSPNEAEKAPATSPALPQATATPTTVQKNDLCSIDQPAKSVVNVSTSCMSMMPKIESVFTLADTDITTNASAPVQKVPLQNISNCLKEDATPTMPYIPTSQVTLVTELTTDELRTDELPADKTSTRLNFHSASTLLQQLISAKMQNLPTKAPQNNVKTHAPNIVTNSIQNLQSKTCVQTPKSVSSIMPLQMQSLPSEVLEINHKTLTPDSKSNSGFKCQSKLSAQTSKAVSSSVISTLSKKLTKIKTIMAGPRPTERKLSSVLPLLPPATPVSNMSKSPKANIISKLNTPELPIVTEFRKATSKCMDTDKKEETNIQDADQTVIRTNGSTISGDSVMSLSSTFVGPDTSRKATINIKQAQSAIVSNVSAKSSSLNSSNVDNKSKVPLDVPSKPITPKKVPQCVEPQKDATPAMPLVSEEEQDDESTDSADSPMDITQDPLEQEVYAAKSQQSCHYSTEKLNDKLFNELIDVQNSVNNNNSSEVQTEHQMQEVEKDHDSDIKEKVTLQADCKLGLSATPTRGSKRKADKCDPSFEKVKQTTRHSNQSLTSESESETNMALKVKYKFSQKTRGSEHSTNSNSPTKQEASEAIQDLESNTVYFPDGPIVINNANGLKFEFDQESMLLRVNGKVPKLVPVKKLTATDAMALGCSHGKKCPLAQNGAECRETEEKLVYEPEKASNLVALTKNSDFKHISRNDRVAYLKELQKMQRAALGMT